MAAAAVLSPSSSGLSTPSDLQFSNSLESSRMEHQVTPMQTQNFLTSKMVAILQELGYDTSSINTLITRADSNTITATDIAPTDILDNDVLPGSKFLETTLLDQQTLHQRNIYLNSNEPVLLIAVPTKLELRAQQVRDLKEEVLAGLRDHGIKPVRVYVREDTEYADEDAGLNFSLLNVVNSDIGVNMVSLLDRAFYGADWKEDLVIKEGWNGYDLIWRDEAWRVVVGKQEEGAAVVVEPVSTVEDVENASIGNEAATVDEDVEPEAKQAPVESGNAGAELQRMPSAPVRRVSYKSAEDVPEDTDEEEPEPVQHPALKELLERDAQRPPVQYPTWSRSHDSEAYLDVIKTHSRGQDESQPISTITRPDDEKDDFEVVDKP